MIEATIMIKLSLHLIQIIAINIFSHNCRNAAVLFCNFYVLFRMHSTLLDILTFSKKICIVTDQVFDVIAGCRRNR